MLRVTRCGVNKWQSAFRIPNSEFKSFGFHRAKPIKKISPGVKTQTRGKNNDVNFELV
jgi:hypothetical protein